MDRQKIEEQIKDELFNKICEDSDIVGSKYHKFVDVKVMINVRETKAESKLLKKGKQF